GQRHPDGDADHVLLGDAHVEEAVGKARDERFDDAEPEVTDDEVDTGILLRQLEERPEERRPHLAASSATARRSSSSSGGRWFHRRECPMKLTPLPLIVCATMKVGRPATNGTA